MNVDWLGFGVCVEDSDGVVGTNSDQSFAIGCVREEGWAIWIC